MVFSITVNYIVGLLMARYEKKKKLFLIIGIIINLLLLGYFKYIGFFTGIINTFFSNVAVKTVALPIGISFYTFSAVSYIVDVHRGELEARSLEDVAAYVTFFPKLTSGPIQRGGDFFAQSDRRRNVGLATFLPGVHSYA